MHFLPSDFMYKKGPKAPSSNKRSHTIIIIIIIMFMKGQACFLFLDPQDVVGPSISSSVVLRSFVPLVYIVVLVLVVYLCPSSVRVVATFSGNCFISFTMFCAPVFSLTHWFFSLSSFVIPSKCHKNFICAASKRCSSLFFSTQSSLPNFSALFNRNVVNSQFCFFVHLFSKMSLRIVPLILLYVCSLSSKSLLYSVNSHLLQKLKTKFRKGTESISRLSFRHVSRKVSCKM